MTATRTAPRALLAALLVAGLGVVGCSDDDDGGGSQTSSLVGIWQHTVTGDWQGTMQLAANGDLDAVVADYEVEECDEFGGGWSADADSLTTTIAGNVSTVAWSRSGSTLTITDPEDGSTTVYASVAALPSCDDYGWGSAGLWNGTLTATVDGSAVNFGTFLYAEVEGGLTAFGGHDGGQRQVQLTILGAAPGSYALGGGNMGVFVPDTNNPTVVMTTITGIAPGTVELTTVSATRIVGSFSFTAINSSTLETVTVTDGVVDITAN